MPPKRLTKKTIETETKPYDISSEPSEPSEGSVKVIDTNDVKPKRRTSTSTSTSTSIKRNSIVDMLSVSKNGTVVSETDTHGIAGTESVEPLPTITEPPPEREPEPQGEPEPKVEPKTVKRIRVKVIKASTPEPSTTQEEPLTTPTPTPEKTHTKTKATKGTTKTKKSLVGPGSANLTESLLTSTSNEGEDVGVDVHDTSGTSTPFGVQTNTNTNTNLKPTSSNVLGNIKKPVIVNLPIREEDIDRITAGSHHYEDHYYEYDPTINEPAAFNSHQNTTFCSMPEEIQSTQQQANEHDDTTCPVSVEPSTNANHRGAHLLCFWCCHHFENDPFGIPIKFQDGKFLTQGIFCSLECACSENFRSVENGNAMWERYNLINAMARHINYRVYVSAAPPKTSLKAFGGTMTIDEFRKNMMHNRTLIHELPYPMIAKKTQVAEIRNFYKETKTFIPIDIERVHKLEQKLKDSTREKDTKGIYEKMYMKKVDLEE
jgi:hypothetical protein